MIWKSTDIKPEYNQAVQFLQFLVREKQIKSKIIHNTFLSILISYPNVEKENLIIKYLETQQKSRSLFGKSVEYEIFFDQDFILRLCFKHKKIQSAIFIYSMLGNYEEAVQLALDNDLIDVAVFVAGKPLESSSQRKKLWLNISEKLIKKVIMNDKFLKQHQKLLQININGDPDELENMSTDNKISNLLNYLLSKCELLTVKDLLPLFPDFIVIDNFKEELPGHFLNRIMCHL
ncbi:unnamed protein product [Ambrosiozyma monospora]|uniref:Unnamed protein product n=1 Tax=Ambrosiozyma monospora TaxID=43982 RepID=A0ACB5T9T2_AMBMO|nr:unnamed protein product [Ambrosiozyma monospora]